MSVLMYEMSPSLQTSYHDAHCRCFGRKFKPDGDVKAWSQALFVAIGSISTCFAKIDVNLYYLRQFINFSQKYIL